MRRVLVLDVAKREHRPVAGADEEVGRGRLPAGHADASASLERGPLRVARDVPGGGNSEPFHTRPLDGRRGDARIVA